MDKAAVYALIFSVGISSGHNKVIGVYTSKERAEKAKQEEIREKSFAEHHYSIQTIPLDKTINIVYAEW